MYLGLFSITVRYNVVFTFDRNCVYLVPFSRYIELFVKGCKFFLPYVYLTPPLRVTVLEFHRVLWLWKIVPLYLFVWSCY